MSFVYALPSPEKQLKTQLPCIVLRCQTQPLQDDTLHKLRRIRVCQVLIQGTTSLARCCFKIFPLAYTACALLALN